MKHQLLYAPVRLQPADPLGAHLAPPPRPLRPPLHDPQSRLDARPSRGFPGCEGREQDDPVQEGPARSVGSRSREGGHERVLVGVAATTTEESVGRTLTEWDGRAREGGGLDAGVAVKSELFSLPAPSSGQGISLFFVKMRKKIRTTGLCYVMRKGPARSFTCSPGSAPREISLSQPGRDRMQVNTGPPALHPSQYPPKHLPSRLRIAFLHPDLGLGQSALTAFLVWLAGDKCGLCIC